MRASELDLYRSRTHEATHAVCMVAHHVEVLSISVREDGGGEVRFDPATVVSPEINFAFTIAGELGAREIVDGDGHRVSLRDVLSASEPDFDAAALAALDHYRDRISASEIWNCSWANYWFERTLEFVRNSRATIERLADCLLIPEGRTETRIGAGSVKWIATGQWCATARAYRRASLEREQRMREEFEKSGRTWPFPPGVEFR